MPIERELSKILAMPDDDFFKWRAAARELLATYSDAQLSALYEASSQEFDARAAVAWSPAKTSDDSQPPARYDVSRLNDHQVIAERQRIITTLAALTDHYRALNQAISERETLKWMLAPSQTQP